MVYEVDIGASRINQMDNIMAMNKRVGQTLRYFAVIAEQTGEGIAVADPNGTLKFINQAWAAMHGCQTKSELVGRSISACHTDEQMKTAVIPFFEQARSTDCAESLVWHARKDGTTFPTQARITQVKDETGTPVGLIIFATDVSELRQAQLLLKQKTKELTEANEQLQPQIAARKQAEQQLAQKTAQVAAAKQQLQRQITERNKLESELQQYRTSLEQVAQVAQTVTGSCPTARRQESPCDLAGLRADAGRLGVSAR